MSSRNWLSSLLLAPPSHHETLSRLDLLDGRTEQPAAIRTEDKDADR